MANIQGERMELTKYGSHMYLLLGQIMLDVQNVLMHEIRLNILLRMFCDAAMLNKGRSV